MERTMALTVRAILKERLERLSGTELDEDVIIAYFDHAMVEKNVDQNNPEVIKAARAYLEFVDCRSALEEKSITAFAEGRRDLPADIAKMDHEVIFNEIMSKHDVDFNDQEVNKALEALNDVDNQMIELKTNHIQEMKNAFKLYSAFKPRSRKSPPRRKS
jgi:hypothetical protein